MNQDVNKHPKGQETKKLSVIDLSKRGRQKLRSRQYNLACELFAAGLEQEPENPYLLSGMGDASFASGDFPAAERCYRKLLEVDKNNLFALRGLGDVCKKQNHHQEAIQLWDRYLVLRPEDKFVMTRVAESCKILMLFERAEQVYLQILKKSPNDRFALTGLADLQYRLGKESAAIETYEKVLKFDKNELHILTIVGKLCWRISDFERSEGYFKRALEIDPENPYALFGLGNCYRWYRQYDKAIDVWQKILSRSEGTQTLHARMGNAYFSLGCFADAELSYRKSLEFGEDIFSTAALVCLCSERKDWVGAAYFLGLLIVDKNKVKKQLEILTKRSLHTGQQQSMMELLRHLSSESCIDQAILAELEKQLTRLS